MFPMLSIISYPFLYYNDNNQISKKAGTILNTLSKVKDAPNSWFLPLHIPFYRIKIVHSGSSLCQISARGLLAMWPLAGVGKPMSPLKGTAYLYHCQTIVLLAGFVSPITVVCWMTMSLLRLFFVISNDRQPINASLSF